MANINFDKFKKAIETEIKNFEKKTDLKGVGFVLSVGDGIAVCYGLEGAMMGEKVIFKSKAEGLVFNLEENQVGVILLKNVTEVKEGEEVNATGEIFSVPVGYELLGRVIDPLGNPIDGLGDFKTKKVYPIERKAYSVIDRGKVDTPLETGIQVIDALIPIGRGQRELIIGDRQTGKTSIAIDTIINQKGKDVYCVYVAIGQKESSVAQIKAVLAKHGALDYTVIVSASAFEEGSIQYLAPFSGASIAEFFMEEGKDALVIYDDLSKHAVAYRELSLLLKRPPGREAYPGDIFYLHSRLLERSAKLSDKLKGGSVTALPIVETKAGDISSYIPTNVISITDGQIYLETKLFYQGIRPAVNSGLSVSRVGGAAQTKAIKSVSGLLRINLASYRELESFAQFSQDLDPQSRRRLNRGQKTVELLKQDIHELRPIYFQAVSLYALNNGYFDNIETSQIGNVASLLNDFLETKEDGIKIKDYIINKKELPSKEILDKFLDKTMRYFNA